MSGPRKPLVTAADSKDVKSSPVIEKAVSPSTDGKAGTPVSYALYIMPTVDLLKAPPAALKNAVILCPEEAKEGYTAYFVRNGEWVKDKSGIKKLRGQKFVLAELAHDKAVNKLLALGGIPTLAALPHDILTDSIRSHLKLSEAAALPKLSQSMHSSFQSTLDASTLLRYVAYGLQEEAEKMLQKAQAADKVKATLDTKASASGVETSELLRLLRAKNPVTDCSGRVFNEPLTPFQYAFWAMDWHMLRMLDKYVPQEEQAAQIKELRDNKMKYGLVLMSVEPEEKLDLVYLRKLSCHQQNKPILIKQGEKLQLYGYDFEKKLWKLSPIKNTKVFQALAFPQPKLAATIALRVLATAPTPANLPALLPGLNSAYVLVQKERGLYPNALYYVDKSGKQPVITELSGCVVFATKELPHQDKLNQLPFSGNAAYIRSQDKLFYANKTTGECSELKLNEEALKEFDARIHTFPGLEPRYLLAKELQKITQLTGHRQPSPRFSINHNMATFWNAFFQGAEDGWDIAALSAEQLKTITLHTGHPLKVVEKAELREAMYEVLAEGHTQGTEQGVHYDFSRLQEAYQGYLRNFNPENQWNEVWGEYWKEQVGGAQDEVPGHVRDEYCRSDLVFRVPATFMEPNLPRNVGIANSPGFYSREGSNLSYRHAVSKGESTFVGAATQSCLALYQSAELDFAAINRLAAVRTDYVAKLTQQLLAAPELSRDTGEKSRPPTLGL